MDGLTDWQRKELQKICRNDSSFGAFSGMILNLKLQYSDRSTTEIVEEALKIKQQIKYMASDTSNNDDNKEQSSGQYNNKQTIKLKG